MATPLLFDGFNSLEGGVDAGIASSLIGKNQVASACNYSFRGAYPSTRPPYESLILTFNNEVTEANFTGIFQGSTTYQAVTGNSGFVVSRGGRLFRIEILVNGIARVSEITPTLIIVTTADFTVPALNGSVVVSVNSEAVLDVGDSILMDSGAYTITNRATDQITVTYNGGAANATVASGTAILDSGGGSIVEYQTNPATLDFIYLFQAEIFVIVCAAPHRTVIYDGVSARLAEIGEVPPCVFGTYGWGRIWVVLFDRRTFAAGDIVRGPSGTVPYNFIDAILRFTENDFLNEGGSFGVPVNAGEINAMQFLAVQDNSLGIGPLLVGTTNVVFSVNAPVDRTTWKNLRYPIQTVSLLDYGPQGPRSTSPVNGDMWYRSTDGVRSFIVARREITTWGNTPMSREVDPVLSFDTQSLLFYSSAVLFDNRWFVTVSPYRTNIGMAHRGLECINFDLVSNLRGKYPPSWEGLKTGLNLLQVLKGTFNKVERMFGFVVNGEDALELWEFKPESASGYYDLLNEQEGLERSITRTSIQSWLDTRSYDWGNPFQPKQLNMAEIFLDEIVDNVTITIKFKPDQYPSWIDWVTIPICATVSQCSVAVPGEFSCSIWRMNQKQYAARITLPQPPETCNTIAGIKVNVGHEFQFRFEQTGHARIRRFRAHAIPQPQETEGICPAEEATCSTFTACDEGWFTYSSSP
jgi:hypothetical protein